MTTLGLSKYLLETCAKEGFEEPTPIQERVIPLALQRRDILAKAQTGSGKTASFVLPILEMWAKSVGEGKPKIKALVLTPTRELTAQVASAFETLGASLPRRPKVVSIVGGEQIGEQLFAVQKGCDIVVATSGRLLDILDKKQMNLSHLEFFVLDEADKMLDLGFATELDLILASIPAKRQNMLFSATYPPKVLDIVSKITQEPVSIEIEDEEPTVENITQRAIEVNRENRSQLLRHLLQSEKWGSVLVFMASKRATENISVKFHKYGFKAYSFHGDLEQNERRHTLDEFKKRKIQILFATDIAARGLDVEGLECVVNFDLPRSPADYIHRIGRTGRAGKSGVAVSFISHEDKEHFALIEKRCGIKLERESVKGFELTGEAASKPKGGEPIKGKRKSKKDKAREAAAAQNKEQQ
ncbi:MAG: DEAD/DEAH box helicase [Campylobacterales bacterium]|nr:DEAD/DEAH box helicase [Campylobacterales bacterium]